MEKKMFVKFVSAQIVLLQIGSYFVNVADCQYISIVTVYLVYPKVTGSAGRVANMKMNMDRILDLHDGQIGVLYPTTRSAHYVLYLLVQ